MITSLFKTLSFIQRLIFIVNFLVTSCLIASCFYLLITKILIPFKGGILLFFYFASLIYFLFNILDLINYDRRLFKKLSKNGITSLWFCYYYNRRPYRLKEFVYDSPRIATFLFSNIKYAPVFMLLAFVSYTCFFFFAIIFTPILWLRLIAILNFILIAKIAKLNVVIELKPEFSELKNLKDLLFFIFIFSPETLSFAIVYTIFLNPLKKKKEELKSALESILFSRLVGKSKWFLFLLITLFGDAVQFFESNSWKLKLINCRNLNYSFVTFFNNFLIEHCTLTYSMFQACKIIIKGGLVDLNPSKEVITVFDSSRAYLQKKISHGFIKNTVVKVGFKNHKAVGFVPEKQGEVSSQYIKTFKNKYWVNGIKYKAEEYDKQAQFRFPRNRSWSLDDGSEERYGDKQYATSTFVSAESIVTDKSELVSNALKYNFRNKILLEKALELSILKSEELRLAALLKEGTEISNPFNAPKVDQFSHLRIMLALQKSLSDKNNSVNEFIVQCQDPKNGKILSIEQISSNLCRAEQEFLFEVNELSDSINTVISGISFTEKSAALNIALKLVKQLNEWEFSQLFYHSDRVFTEMLDKFN